MSYNRENRTCRIPNQEVRQEFERTIQDTGWEVIANAINHSEQLLKDTLAGNAEAVAKAIEIVHHENTSILQYNDENALAYVVSLAYQTAHQYYKFVRELPAGKGFADIVLVPYRNIDKPAIVIELKYNKSAEGAIKQIKEKQYVDALRGYAGNIVLVGINYDKRTKRHDCKIERISDKDAIKYNISGGSGHTENHTENHAENYAGLSRLQKEVIQMLKANPKCSRRELVTKIDNASLGGIISAISRLQELGILRRVGPDKGGHWEIIPTER